MTIQRCGWCSSDPLYIALPWRRMGQAWAWWSTAIWDAVSWGTTSGIVMDYRVEKTWSYRAHFFQYSITEVAALTDDQLGNKLSDAGLIRHLGKLKAIRDNALAWLKLKDEVNDVSAWLWNFVDHQTPNNDVLIIVKPQPRLKLASNCPKP